MSDSICGCCACLAGAGQPVEITNRPGLSSLRYRIGTHATFFDAMIRRLTVPVDPLQPSGSYSLHGLTTREKSDATIALLDAWATVGEVLTFYQERIANEAFLRTATERRSILELGRLVGYTLKPGVAASVYLAYTLDETAQTIVPAGSKAQSIPGAGEQPQMFETSVDIEARGAWNALQPRMSRPQDITIDDALTTIDDALTISSLWIDGTTTRLEVRDPLLLVFAIGDKKLHVLRRTLRTNFDTERKRTEVVLEPVRPYYVEVAAVIRRELKSSKDAKLEAFLQHLLLGVPRTTLMKIAAEQLKLTGDVKKAVDLTEDVDPPADPPVGRHSPAELLAPLVKARAIAPKTPWQFTRSLERSLGSRSDFVPRLLKAFYPQLDETLYTALANDTTGRQPYAQLRGVYVLRRLGAVFGYNAPTVLFEERPSHGGGIAAVGGVLPPMPAFVEEAADVLHLDTPAEAVTVGSYVVLQSAGTGASVATVREADTLPRTAYGISGRSTRLALSDDWWTVRKPDQQLTALEAMLKNLELIRSTVVLVQSEQLTLAQQPIDRPIGREGDPGVGESESATRIELDGVVDGLVPGRWIIVSGEREDTSGTAGIVSSELAMIDNVEQRTDAGAGGTAYSTLVLAPAGLAYEYKRDTVRILANVVKASNGETRSEILGAGDASRPMQSFLLHQSPLTFVAAPTVSGVRSTLAIRVNEVAWHEATSLAVASPTDRVFVTQTSDDGKVSVVFGNGAAGARLPSGADNVRAIYRSGLGRAGNVRARQIATAISRPLGVRDVVNPLPASGGADPESRDDARRNIPVSLQAMGRVVSVPDYADFARTFAGISKASAVAISDGRRRVVHLTIGGAGDIEIAASSDLYRNLVDALRAHGDRYQPIVVAVRERIVIVGAARVRVAPDYLFADVAPRIRAALLDRFAYDRREFAQAVYPAEVIATIQSVAGVLFVDLDALGGIEANDVVVLRDPQSPDTGSPSIAAVAGAPKAAADGDGAKPLRVESARAIVPRLARRAHDGLRPAQLAYLPAELADLFVLTEAAHG